MPKTIIHFIAMAICFFAAAFSSAQSNSLTEIPKANREAQAERDRLFMLAAYSLTFAHWQSSEIPWRERRGYNIGALLVDSNHRIVHHALNAVNVCNDSTQHAEVRLIQGFIESTNERDIDGHRLYTSLEPCVMCAGMTIMTKAECVVYGQNDDDFSGAIERLSLDSSQIGGYKPYPRSVPVRQCNDPVSTALDAAYAEFRAANPGAPLSRFLASARAWDIMQTASIQLNSYELRFESNQEILDSIGEYLAEHASKPKQEQRTE